MNGTPSRLDFEEGTAFMPRFDAAGLITCVTVDARSDAVLMVAHMNAAALLQTLETGTVTYWSRSRGELWRKGDTSGQVQRLIEMRTDCDQDALLLRVEVGGDGGCCHTGRRSCFYRSVALDSHPAAPVLVNNELTGSNESHRSSPAAAGQSGARSE
jgi:phosphoribosyl-AMP cyclohydrolase